MRPMTVRFRVMFCALAVFVATAAFTVRETPQKSADLPAWMEAMWGLKVTQWVELRPSTTFSSGLYLALASLPRNECNDLYIVRARIMPNGAAVRMDIPLNLTLSEWANDSDMVVQGLQVATLVRNNLDGRVV